MTVRIPAAIHLIVAGYLFLKIVQNPPHKTVSPKKLTVFKQHTSKRENEMKQQRMNEADLMKEMEEMARLGYLEADSDGEYDITPKGIQMADCYQLLEVFDHQHDAAYTFSALVTVTRMKPANIIQHWQN
jgi:hypothetical protein